MQSSLSIIIPVLNEEAVLPTLLERLRKERNKSISEVIVADIGSNDRTIEITHTYDFVPLISSKFADFFRHLLWVLTRFLKKTYKTLLRFV